MEDLSRYCAPGATAEERMIAIDDDVSLRVVHFEPSEPSPHPPVLFVPGWITRMEAWEAVLPEMTRHFRLFYVETREKISARVGRKTPITVPILGRDLARLVAHFDFEPQGYALVGSSLGATAILEACRDVSAAPRCLVLIGPNASFHIPKAGQWLIRPFPPRLYLLLKPVIKWYLKTFRLDSEADLAQYLKYCRALDAADPYKLKKMALSMPGYQVWDFIGGIDIPALLIGASKDLLHDRDIIQRMAETMPQGRYLDMLTNARTHSPQVVAEIRSYLASLAAR